MPLIKRFEDLKAWQEARELTKVIYKLTETELFRRDRSLVDQVRRASVSVMNNIAEGFENRSTLEFMRYLGVARRSASEIQSCLYVALDRAYCSREGFRDAYDSAERAKAMIAGFLTYLKNREARESIEDQVSEAQGTYAHQDIRTSGRSYG